MTDPDVDMLEDGDTLPEPSDDEDVPVEPENLLMTLPPQFSLLFGSQGRRYAVQMDSHALTAPASKRPGAPLDTFSDKERRTSRDPDETSWDINTSGRGRTSLG